jgi:pilus assembly protein CpaC
MTSIHPFRSLLPATLLACGLLSGTALAQGRTELPLADTDAAASIEVVAGESFIYRGERAINRIVVSDDTVATVNLLEEGQFQVRGLAAGRTDIWVWFRDEPDSPTRYSVKVNIYRDLTQLQESVDGVVGPGGDPVTVRDLGGRLVVEGTVTDVVVLERIAAVASVYDPEFVNLLTVAGDHQVQLEVVFAEVSRSRLRDLGVDLWWDSGSLIPGAGVTLGSGAPPGVAQTFNLVGTLTAGFDLMASLKVLEQHNLSKVLARPTLVALSGQKAEFLAGGEVPIPVAQFGDRVSIEFREFGVKVSFVPTVLADEVVDVRVYVEVSDIDTTNTLRTANVTIPGFRSRKSQSHLRLASGMTFAMAGMLDERITSTRSKVPGIGDIPILGALFRRVEHNREETELVIFVTPRLVRPLAPDEVPPVPGLQIDNDPGDFEFFMLGLDHQPKRKKKDDASQQPAGPVGVER